MTASKYSYIGGFNGTSNVLAGLKTGIPVVGTHAHSFVMSYSSLAELHKSTITDINGNEVEFVSLVLARRKELNYNATNDGELAAFISYAQAFPNGFTALVDTYDTLQSGTPNFLLVGLALHEVGYVPRGIRLDSGDLDYLSCKVREMFQHVDQLLNITVFSKCRIVASNDINEDILLHFQRTEHEIDVFGKYL
jgi:nicotinate phosphoribosyltransferase